MAGQYAFNSKLLALEIEEPDREEHRLIRVGAVYGGYTAKYTLEMIKSDETGAGKSWSAIELQLGEVHDWASIVVVVGELLVDGDADVAESLAQGQLAQTAESFNPEKHSVIRRGLKKSAVVVARLDRATVSLYALGHKSWNGLCDIRLLEKPTVHSDCLFFYPEWTTQLHGSGGKTARFLQWRSNIAAFIARTTKSTAVRAPAEEPNQPTGEETSTPPPAASMTQQVSDTNSQQTAEATARTSAAVSFGNLLPTPGLAGSDLSGEFLAVKNVICGTDEITISDSAAAVKACNKLWFNQVPGSVRMTIRVQHIQALARGLRAGALRPTVVEERLYRAFVVNFCYFISKVPLGRGQDADADIERDETINEIIRDAYRTTVMAVGAQDD